MTVYSRRGARLLGAVAVLSLAAGALLLMTPGDSTAAEPGADGYSRSAIGHSGLIRWLRDRGETVVQRRTTSPLGDAGLLVFAEPAEPKAEDLDRVSSWCEDALSTLVVLPKWRGIRDPEQGDWIAECELVAVRDVAATARAFATIRGTELTVEAAPEERRTAGSEVVVRAERVSNWRSALGLPVPDVVAPAQLLRRSGAIEPLLECDEGVLLARVGDLCVLADPDVVSNHGLLRGSNADLALAVFDLVRGDGVIVFDETLHGARLEPSIWHAAGEFPFVLVTLHLLLLAALVAWIANGRFGPATEVGDAIAGGKEFLIGNIAALLHRGGHHGHAVRRYARLRVSRAAEALHAPRGLPYAALRDWFVAAMEPVAREKLEAAIGEADQRVSAARATILARTIRELTEEVKNAGR